MFILSTDIACSQSGHGLPSRTLICFSLLTFELGSLLDSVKTPPSSTSQDSARFRPHVLITVGKPLVTLTPTSALAECFSYRDHLFHGLFWISNPCPVVVVVLPPIVCVDERGTVPVCLSFFLRLDERPEAWGSKEKVS